MTMLDWAHFTPWTSLAGGLLLGLAAALFVLINGRVLGISGILGGLLTAGRSDRGWRLAFLLGLLAAPVTLHWLLPSEWIPQARMESAPIVVVVAGLLVGFGTRMGSGCTSGHGVCGLSRRSVRSLAATLCFMAAGIGVVFVARHLIG